MSFPVGGGAAPMSLTLDMAKTTQFGTNFNILENDASGYSAGTFSGLSVEEDGKIFATFTNGESKLQGQVVLASFANTNGLEAGDAAKAITATKVKVLEICKSLPVYS